jgi:hypothetical protein
MNFVSEPRERIYSIRKKVNQEMMSFGTLLPTYIRANIGLTGFSNFNL